MTSPRIFDCVIIGGGLAGLTAGIALQKEGVQTLIVEKRSKLGGLCGTFEIEGNEFVIACNEFGKSIERHFKALGIPQEFKPVKVQFYFDFGRIEIPSGRMFLKLVQCLPDVIRTISVAKKVKKGKLKYVYLNELIEGHILNKTFKELVCSLSYAKALPPKLTRLSDIGATMFDKKLDYGYDKTIIPVGGPGKMVETMTDYYLKLGGEVVLEKNVTNTMLTETEIHQITTSDDECFFAKTLVSSKGRLGEYPNGYKTGLKLGMLLLRIDKRIDYPEKIHTTGSFPHDITKWLDELDEGKWGEEVCFHCFKSDLKNEESHYSLSTYYIVPRGLDVISKEKKQQVRNYIIQKLEKYFPGITNSIVFEEHLDPSEFSAIHNGMESYPFPVIMEGAFEKPEIYSEKEDIYYIGNTVNPPGEHACGAVLSGIKAAEMIVGNSSQDSCN